MAAEATARRTWPVWVGAALYTAVRLALLPALQACCAAALFCGRGPRAAALAGGLFGLAWLTRSTAMLALPAVGVFLVLRDGWKAALRDAGVFAAAAVLVALPWLWHTA